MNSPLSLERLGRLRDAMSGYVERGEVPGIVAMIYRRGEVHAEAFGALTPGGAPVRRDSIFRIASMTKPIIAAAAMILVEECRLRLDDPVDELLPELAGRRVLRRLDGPVDDTVAANRPITLRDLLTFRLGFGAVMAPPGTYPIQEAIAEAGLAPSPTPPAVTPDEWMKRLGQLPLLHQPGEAWMYHTGSDILGVLIARASGQELEAFLKQRLFDPLGMKDTGFHVPAAKADRLPAVYVRDPETGGLRVFDDPQKSAWTRPPVFASGGGGLVSTAGDYLAFCRMLLGKGRLGRERILSRPAVELMTADHLTAEQKEAAGAGRFFGGHSGWGFGGAVNLRRTQLWQTPGRFGWDGGFGTSGYTDPQEDLTGILLTQRMMESPQGPRVFTDFWTLVYQSLED
ncbi:serine hydrolase domain-containing protein [Paenibacillus caseinilyticus]|uniref:serine hydrolase domain-containing protein n=1 Tax=Paenibacillus caseinilyticus TaxID=3098138 RepID=UPI0022B92AB6|nr:serine hydrolase domain-containing protein [Paenibacillus caseinilyticus]MCZ8523029.1 serine hydrolase [Paenibacillus caseinilyticus]